MLSLCPPCIHVWCRDHAGGNHRIAEHLPKVEIVGGAKDKVPACTRTVADGEQLRVGDLVITVLETPL